MEIYENFLEKYNAEDMLLVDENNMYYCNYKMFDENGNIVKTRKGELDGKNKSKSKHKHSKKFF
jgi:hypothetical protein